MSRSLVLPLLALASIVLYGTTRAASPGLVVPAESPRPLVRDVPEPRPMPVLPPPAPRLRSEEAPEAPPEPDSVAVGEPEIPSPSADED